MFRWLNKQGVAKDNLFYLQRVDRFHYEYGEDGVTLKVPVESTDRGEELFVSDALASAGDAADRRGIAANIEAALDFMGVRHSLQ